MKLSNVTAKLTSIKSNVVRVLAAATLAGAVLAVAAPSAEAQRVVVRYGGPRVFVPAPPVRFYGGPVYFNGYDHHDWRYDHRDWRYRHDGFRR
jgi:hypothetical protein